MEGRALEEAQVLATAYIRSDKHPKGQNEAGSAEPHGGLEEPGGQEFWEGKG